MAGTEGLGEEGLLLSTGTCASDFTQCALQPGDLRPLLTFPRPFSPLAGPQNCLYNAAATQPSSLP